MMKNPIGLFLTMTAALLVSAQTRADDPAPPIPETPAAIEEVVYAQPFRLARGYPFEWRNEKNLLTEGTILVLRVAPALAYLRQGYNPVLYVGNSTAERVNQGYPSGYVLVVVPGLVDPAKTPIWFGSADVLPEQVDAAKIAAERALADAAGIRAQAVARGGEMLELSDRDALQPHLAEILGNYSPAERDLIAQLNASGGSSD